MPEPPPVTSADLPAKRWERVVILLSLLGGRPGCNYFLRLSPARLGKFPPGHLFLHLDYDEQGRLTYKGKVIRIYPKQRMKKIYHDRQRYSLGGKK